VSVLWEKGPPFLLPALVFVKAGKGKESLFIILSQLSAGQQLTILGEKDSNPHKQIQSLRVRFFFLFQRWHTIA
jgi:hypothetical protein